MTTVQALPARGAWLLERGRAFPVRIPRSWLAVHLGTLVVLAIALVVAGRNQYFFFDEWDFLSPRAEWDLLGSHIGHLSLFPQLLTTVLKSLFGLHSYQPYLLAAFAVHLVVVHLIWRVMVRSGTNFAVATVTAILFAVLAPAADDVLWAFQVGFMAPFAFGLAALLLAMRPVLDRLATIVVTILLTVAVGFSGTAIPMVAVTLLVIVVRHGWRRAALPAAVVGVLYGGWYLAFNRGPHSWDQWRADTPRELVLDVPQFVAHGFVDSVAQFLPLAGLAAPILVALALWAVVMLRRSGAREMSPVLYLVLGLVLFSLLTALSRVGLGLESASAPRYTYVYGLLLAPLAAAAATALVGRSRAAAVAVLTALAVLTVYNGAGFALAARDQAAQEQTVLRTASAGLRLVGCDGDVDRMPSLIVAPQLTMGDLCVFVARGQFDAVASTPEDDLDALVNLRLTATPASESAAGDCAVADGTGGVPFDPATDALSASAGGVVRLTAERDGVTTRFAGVVVPAGVSTLGGVGSDVTLHIAAGESSICVLAAAG